MSINYTPMSFSQFSMETPVTVSNVLFKKGLSIARDVNGKYISINAKSTRDPNAAIAEKLIYNDYYRYSETLFVKLKQIASSSGNMSGIINTSELRFEPRVVLSQLSSSGLIRYRPVMNGYEVAINPAGKTFLTKNAGTLHVVNKRLIHCPDELYYNVKLVDNRTSETMNIDVIERKANTVNYYMVVANPNVMHMSNYLTKTVKLCNRLRKNVKIVVSPSINAIQFKAFIAGCLDGKAEAPAVISIDSKTL